MKVAFVFGTKFTQYHGDYYSVNLSNEMLSERYLDVFDEMVVVCRSVNASGDPSGRMKKCNSDRISFRTWPNLSPLKRFCRLYGEKKFLMDSVKDCDFVICRGTWGAKICRKLGKRYMIELVSCAWDAFWNHGALGKIVAPYMFLKTKHEVAKADRVLYVTNNFLQKRYPTSGESVGISDVALNEFNDKILEERLKKISQYQPGQKLILGTIAAIDVPYKGQRFVISALGELKKRGITSFEYHLVGNGNIEALLRCAKDAGIEDQIKILGGKSHEQVFTWLDTIDIYIQPSLQEGLPRAMVEAMSRALPCVGTPTGGIPELIESDYICENKRNIPQKIAEILLAFDFEKMKRAAQYNYYKSKKYDAVFLKNQRKEFFQHFMDGVNK